MEFTRFTSLENTYNGKIVGKITYEGHNTGLWMVTEKLHGANFSFWCDGKEVRVASRNQWVDGTFYNCQAVINRHSPAIMEFHKENCNEGDVLTIFGELYGHGVQKEVHYGSLRFSAFDVRINGSVLNKLHSREVCMSMRIASAPVLFMGSYEECMEVSHIFRSLETPEDFEGENEAEGVVIEPVTPMFFNNGSRIYLKKKTESFTEKKSRANHASKVVAEFTEEEQVLFDSVMEYATEARVRNVLSKFGVPTQKDFGRIVGETVSDMIEEFEKETGRELKKEAENVWKVFAKRLQGEVTSVARPVILASMEV